MPSALVRDALILVLGAILAAAILLSYPAGLTLAVMGVVTLSALIFGRP